MWVKGYWRVAGTPIMHMAASNVNLRKAGYTFLYDGKRLGITVFQPRLKVCTFARTNSYEYGKQRQVQESP